MRYDRYLNLCLEQAARSPLFYRRGSVTFKGGKVFGQGFNDYRSGYDGGAPEDGPDSDRALSTRRQQSVRQQPLRRLATRPLSAPEAEDATRPTYASVYGCSKMMVIHSVLASPSTLAACTVPHI